MRRRRGGTKHATCSADACSWYTSWVRYFDLVGSCCARRRHCTSQHQTWADVHAKLQVQSLRPSPTGKRMAGACNVETRPGRSKEDRTNVSLRASLMHRDIAHYSLALQ